MKNCDLPFDVIENKNMFKLIVRDGFDLEKVVIPRAIVFAKSYNCVSGVRLVGFGGFEVLVYPNSSTRELVEKYNQELFRTCGIEI